MPDAVAIVGAGCVTPLAFGVDATRRALLAGRTGVGVMDDAPRGSGLELAALVEKPYLRREVPSRLEAQIKFLNGAGRLAVEAVGEAWAASGWSDDELPGERKGLYLSQMDAGDWACREFRAGFWAATEAFEKPLEAERLNREIARRTKPFFILESLKNNAFSFLANRYELKGANTAVAGWSGATFGALDFATRTVARGDLDRALVVGAGRAAHGVSRVDARRHRFRRAEEGEAAFRAFDEGGAGEVRGEAAAALALERTADAQAAGRTVLAEILGLGVATGETIEGLPAPSAKTVTDAAGRALEDAAIDAADLAFVVVHALGLPEADREVLTGLGAIESLAAVPVVSWRPQLGNTPLAGELVDLALAVRALGAGEVPGTWGTREPVSGAEIVRRTSFAPAGGAALVLTAGLYGNVSAMVVRVGAAA